MIASISLILDKGRGSDDYGCGFLMYSDAQWPHSYCDVAQDILALFNNENTLKKEYDTLKCLVNAARMDSLKRQLSCLNSNNTLVILNLNAREMSQQMLIS